MKTIFIQSNSVEISADAHIVDLGEIPEVNLFIKENCRIRYTFIPQDSSDFVRHIKIAENVDFMGKSVITHDGKTRITIEAVGDNASEHLELLAIAQTDAKISVEGVAKVDSPYKNLFLRVDQTNILIVRFIVSMVTHFSIFSRMEWMKKIPNFSCSIVRFCVILTHFQKICSKKNVAIFIRIY